MEKFLFIFITLSFSLILNQKNQNLKRVYLHIVFLVIRNISKQENHQSFKEMVKNHKVTIPARKITSIDIKTVGSHRRSQLYANKLMAARRKGKFLKFRPVLESIQEEDE